MKSKIFALGIGLLAANAFPSLIDFTDAVFASAHGKTTFSTTVDGVGLTFKAGPKGTALFWDGSSADGADGFGVSNDNKSYTPGVGYDPDEIDGRERLAIIFDQALFLKTIDLTDLFREHRSGVGYYNEVGSYSLNGGASWINFSADPTAISYPTTNGEKSLIVNAYVDSLLFRAPGKVSGQDHEFSVRGISYGNPPPPAVPEPSTMALFGMALLSLFGYSRFRRR